MPDREQKQCQQNRVDHGAREPHRKQHQHVAKVEKSDVDPQDPARQDRDRRITQRCNRSHADDDRPFDFMLQEEYSGDDDSPEQHKSGPWARKSHQGKHHPEARIPGGDWHPFVYVNEADPSQEDVCRQARSGDRPFQGTARRVGQQQGSRWRILQGHDPTLSIGAIT